MPSDVIFRRLLLAAILSGIALVGTWCSIQWAPTWAAKLAPGRPEVRSYTQIASSAGAVLGTILAALLGDLLGRRLSYLALCAASILVSIGLYQLNTEFNAMFLVWVFLTGGITASFYGWLPLYLPELFPTAVRATGQGFGFNFGRLLAAIGALQLGSLINTVFKGSYPAACSLMCLVYLLGVIVLFAPETKGKPLPD
jgi:MFS family permease